MRAVINIHEAKTHLSRIIEEVAAGKEVVIAKAGTDGAPGAARARGKAEKVRNAEGQNSRAGQFQRSTA